MVRIILVDDQTLVRSGIRGLLGLIPDMQVIAEAAHGHEALSVIAQTSPDVLLLDIRMPGMSGLEVLQQLKQRGDLPPTILLTTFDDDEALLQAMRLGARGFLLKDISPEKLAEAIRHVVAGQTIFQPAVTERMRHGLKIAEPDFACIDQPEVLTTREIEVLRLLATGFSNREIGEALGSSEGTVKNHVSNIISKLGVRDRVRAALKGLELGYL